MFEDADWSVRAARSGHQLVVVPSSVVQHKVSRSFQRDGGALGAFYFTRNGLLFNRKHQACARRPLLQFLWVWLLRTSLQDFRHRVPGRGLTLAMRSAGALCFLTGQSGPAPAWALRVNRCLADR